MQPSDRCAKCDPLIARQAAVHAALPLDEGIEHQRERVEVCPQLPVLGGQRRNHLPDAVVLQPARQPQTQVVDCTAPHLEEVVTVGGDAVDPSRQIIAKRQKFQRRYLKRIVFAQAGNNFFVRQIGFFNHALYPATWRSPSAAAGNQTASWPDSRLCSPKSNPLVRRGSHSRRINRPRPLCAAETHGRR